jgi:flagellar protein FliL
MSDPKTDNSAAKPKGGKMKKILIALFGVIAIGGGSAGAAVYLTGGLQPKGAEHEEPDHPKLLAREGADEALVEAARRRSGRPDPKLFQASYIAIEENFTSNLAGGTTFVQIGIGLSTYYDERVAANVERHKLAIRSAVLMILSEQDAVALSGLPGKNALRRTLTRTINEVLEQREGFGGIDDVHYTGFVMQ